jgi:hypothetical protein
MISISNIQARDSAWHIYIYIYIYIYMDDGCSDEFCPVEDLFVVG